MDAILSKQKTFLKRIFENYVTKKYKKHCFKGCIGIRSGASSENVDSGGF
jgi:hypothetical protein